jgi:hypothetical protein
VSTLALRMDCGTEVVRAMVEKAKEAGFVTDKMRLTESGIKAWKPHILNASKPKEDRERERPLYVPTSWCTGRATVQPSILEDKDLWE